MYPVKTNKQYPLGNAFHATRGELLDIRRSFKQRNNYTSAQRKVKSKMKQHGELPEAISTLLLSIKYSKRYTNTMLQFYSHFGKRCFSRPTRTYVST